MVGSSVYTLLALVAIVIQTCPTNARHLFRHANSNTNINANINTHRGRSRRNNDVPAVGKDVEDTRQKSKEKLVQTAVVASAAANAAKTVTRALAKELSESTADAVADAVVRVLATGATQPIPTRYKGKNPIITLVKKVKVQEPEPKSRRAYLDPEPASDDDGSETTPVPPSERWSLDSDENDDNDDETILGGPTNTNVNSNTNLNRMLYDPYMPSYPFMYHPSGGRPFSFY